MQGIVTTAFGKYATVYHDGRYTNCTIAGKVRKDPRMKEFSDPLAVGDVVEWEPHDDGEGVITEIHPRRNAFTRKDKGSRRRDIISANLDQVALIQSLANPEPNFRFVDRVVIRAESEGIPVLLCMNKTDLAQRAMVDYVKEYYNGVDMDIHFISAAGGMGLGDLTKAFAGQRTMFVGNSGVGKSTLLNALYPGLSLATSAVSEGSGKGRHTTTNVTMVLRDDGTEIIDSPGMRAFGLMDIEPEELAYGFMEFGPLARHCRFQPCTHDHEPDCAVKRAVEDTTIHADRYQSYLYILTALREYRENRFKGGR